MTLQPGTRLGGYDILAQIGVGGMGEVYHAKDTRLKRDVALKVLPDSVSHDADRLARFQREAELLATLNHQNIAAIYGLEDANGVRALVLELVDGPTLADRIASGPIPLDEALPISRQIADALEAAHEKGVIHRDLKPANIKLTANGQVKVLDFGLAKLLDFDDGSTGPSRRDRPGLTNSPTITTPAKTMAGVILGTAAYMSPEQARGKTVDRRADIWAFGCVLYEILTTHRVFDAEEVSDTLALVLTKDPDWTALPTATPPAIHRLLRRCLVKDRNARLPDVGSARLEIDEARLEQTTPQTNPRGTSSGGRGRQVAVLLVTAVATAVLSTVAAWMVIRAQPAGQPITRSLIGVTPAERLLSGFRLDPSMAWGRPSRTALALSPDGRSLVFSAEREGRVQLYVRRFDQLEATPISGTDGASNPFFSPDGQTLGFHADGTLKKVPLAGGPVVELCKVDAIYGATWGRRDLIVFARQTGGLWQVTAAGGTPTALTTLQADAGEISHRLPQLLPEGQTVLFTVTKSSFPSWDDTMIVAQSLTSGSRKVLIDGGADARFVATGRLLYLRRGTLMAVPFDGRRSEITGAAVGLVADVMQAANIQPAQIDTGAGQFAVSDSGSLVYVTGGVFSQDRWSLAWVDRAGRSEDLRIAPGAYAAARISPDGKRVAFNSTTEDWDLWTYDVLRRSVARLRIEGDQSVPTWTPDGSRLLFFSLLKNTRGLFQINSDGSGSAEPLLIQKTTSGQVYANSWTPDGSALTISGSYLQGIWLLARDGKTEPRPLVPSGGGGELSPDGQWLAYSDGGARARASGSLQESEVYVQPYPTLTRREQISTDNGSKPVWRRDGRELYYVQDASGDGPLKIRMMAVPIAATPTFSPGSPRVLFEGPFRVDGPFRGYDVTPDGQRFLMVREVPQPPARVSQIVLVQNWFEELKARVPTK